jgi:hypothetical protein
VISHLLDRALTVYRPTAEGDGAGGQTVTHAAAGDVRAMVSQPNAAERETASQHGVRLSHIVYAEPGADVRRGDQLGGELPSDVPAGSRLRVIAIVRNSRSTYTRIECEITQTEP